MTNIPKAIRDMKEAIAFYEKECNGQFEAPNVGLGNRKTRCVNEATLPIMTCDGSCMMKCANTCYVLKISTIRFPSVRNSQAKNTVLRRIDPIKYYEHFFKEATLLNLPIRLSDGGDIENEEQANALIQVSEKYPDI